uniref:Protein yippee-like n=1 Tax=Elaeis guineensis var. tenera TaxID=51953 RepID=A0A6J0PIZ2_ELAGV|nr:protein yippee-like isoform X2 [Elaeis guineensis]
MVRYYVSVQYWYYTIRPIWYRANQYDKACFKAPNLLAFTEFQLVYRECHLSFLQICNRVNVTVGLKEDRMMMTGLHTVSDIFCVGCGSIVGWKYDAAHDKNQKYKEGKFILERFKVSGPDGSHYWVSHDPHVGGSDADDA